MNKMAWLHLGLIVTVTSLVFMAWSRPTPIPAASTRQSSGAPLGPPSPMPKPPQILPDESASTRAKSGTVRVRILTYHHIADPPGGRQESYYVSPDLFRQQLDYLQQHGYHTLNLDQLLQHLTERQVDPAAVVLTFDDADEDQYTYAYPELKKHGLSGVFFVPSQKLGRRGYMTKAQLIEMDQTGMVIAAHSRTHATLTRLPKAQLDDEVSGSKHDLEMIIDHSVDYFAYPGGSQNAVVIKAVQQAGYKAAFGIRHSIDHDPNNLWNIDRVHIDDDMPNLIDRLHGKNF